MEREPVQTRADELLRSAGKAEALAPERLEAVWKKTEQAVKAPVPSVSPSVKVGGLVAALVLGGAWWLSRSPGDAVDRAGTPSDGQTRAGDSSGSGAARAGDSSGTAESGAERVDASGTTQTGAARAGDSSGATQTGAVRAGDSSGTTQTGGARAGDSSGTTKTGAGRVDALGTRKTGGGRVDASGAEQSGARRVGDSSGMTQTGAGRVDASTGDARAADSPPRTPTDAVAEEDPLLAEAKLLRDALGLLRDRADPAGALHLLDTHSTRFPSGVLRKEVSLVRVEALIVSRRRPEALQALLGLELDDSPRGAELRVLQGELLLEANRRSEAQRTFGLALEGALAAPLRDRALYGSAMTLDGAPRRAALEAYLASFPNGRFATAARDELESPP